MLRANIDKKSRLHATKGTPQHYIFEILGAGSDTHDRNYFSMLPPVSQGPDLQETTLPILSWLC